MKKIVITLTSLLIMMSCSNDLSEIQSEEEANQQENSICEENPIYENHPILGQWYLIQYAAFAPIRNFNNGEISWTFNSDSCLSVVIANGTQVDRIPLNTSGSYTYSINNNELILNNNVAYDFSISENTLIISDNPAADGPMITFSRAVE